MDVRRVKRHEWLPVVRRLRCNPSVKLVAFTAASYGNADGGSIFPGVARLSNVTDLDDTTVKLALKKLRESGLLVRTFEGSSMGRRGGKADEHVLTLPDDPEWLPLLPPDESNPEREAKREAKREADRKRKQDKNRLSQMRNRLSEPSEQVVSDVGNRLSQTTPPVHGPSHVLVDEGHHSDAARRGRAAAPPRPETFTEYAERHRALMADGRELDEDDAEFIDSVIRDNYVEAVLGDLDDEERRTADGMGQNGAHPNAIVNTILKMRGEGQAAYEDAQRCLLGLPDDERDELIEAATAFAAAHYPEAGHRFIPIYAARLARRRRVGAA